jgi:hypothetical protein
VSVGRDLLSRNRHELTIEPVPKGRTGAGRDAAKFDRDVACCGGTRIALSARRARCIEPIANTKAGRCKHP